MNATREILNPRVRGYLYRVIAALTVVLVSFGVIAEGQAEMIAFLAAVVLDVGAVGLAAWHTPVRPGAEDGAHATDS